MEHKEMEPISKNKVLAVEGSDEVNFFKVLLKHLGLENLIDIRDVVGRDSYKEKIPVLVKTSGFERVEVFAVIRDADKSAESAFRSIKNILKKLSLSVPKKMNDFSTGNPKVGIYIMPGDEEQGMLEDLCLKTVKNSPAMKCVNKFCECVKKLEKKPKNMSKTKVQVFLAAMPTIVNCIGLGAVKKYWNLNSVELSDIKYFLNNFR